MPPAHNRPHRVQPAAPLKLLVVHVIDLPLERVVLQLLASIARKVAVDLHMPPGGKAPDGGRYATVGSADAIFTIPRETVKLLSLFLLRK